MPNGSVNSYTRLCSVGGGTLATRQPTSYGADQGNSSALGSSFHVQPFGVMNVIGLLSPGCSYRRSAADDLMGIRWGAGLLDGRQHETESGSRA